ncbi:ABC transporter permease [Eionea flava]
MFEQISSLLFSPSTPLWEVAGLSLQVSGSALLIAVVIGFPTAFYLVLTGTHQRTFIRIVIDTLMALPPVVVGLMVYLLLSRSGPLGIWGLLYTPLAMIMAQTMLITPIVIALSLPLIEQHWQRLHHQLYVLGLQPPQMLYVLIYEARVGIVTITLAVFGRAIAEIGAVMIVGGNIEGHTRVMTTAIATETQQGNLALALALGLLLIVIAFIINGCVHGVRFLAEKRMAGRAL